MAEDTPATEPEPKADWASILDQLETGIYLAFAGNSSGWETPTGAGTIPPELVGRAQQLLSAQHEAEQMLAEKRVIAGCHLDAVNSIPGSTIRYPQLLDVQG